MGTLTLKGASSPPEFPTVERSSSGTQTVEDIQDELDSYLAILQTLKGYPGDEVYRALSGISARLTEIKVQLSRASNAPRASRIIEKEIDTMISECDRQYRYHSRIQASMEMDLKMAGGFA